MVKFLILLLSIACFITCADHGKAPCNNRLMLSVSFLTNRIKIPSKLTKIDTLQYPTKALLFNKTFRHPEDSSYVWIMVNSYEVYPEINLNFNSLKEGMKSKLKSLSRKDDLLITEEIDKINNIEVSFLKSIIKENNKTKCLGHIFFIYPPKKQVEIVIKLNEPSNSEGHTLECIFNSLEIK